MRVIVAVILALGITAPATWSAPDGERSKVNPFFAFCMDTHDSEKRSLSEQAEMLAELGYDGAGHLWLDNLAERLATLDAHGLKLFQVSIRVSLAPDQPPYDARLPEALKLLKGRGVSLALLIGGMPPSDPAGDERAVEVIREISDIAAKNDVLVTLYPHTNDWLCRVDHAVRTARAVDRPHVGVMFNLCHWLRVEEGKDLDGVLQRALPLLQVVSIHGADRADEILSGSGNWIQPLGEGSYNTAAVLDKLNRLGYRGPVGLQCWGITGDAHVHLTRSIAAWREMNELPKKGE